MLKNKSFLFYSLLLLCACAQIVNPNGGEKDTQPPSVKSYKPANLSTRFKTNKIEIEFDEFIQLNNIEEQVSFSPPLHSKPSFSISSKSILIKLSDSLKTNTTYTINFGNAVGDLHENNILSNLTYSFSTGEYLDSLNYNGLILDAFDNTPRNKIIAGLYSALNFNDSIPIKEKPLYYNKTNGNGEFYIRNLPADSFILFAFSDENNNLKLDLGEELAFSNKPINFSDSTQLKLPLFKPELYKPNNLVDTFFNEPGKITCIIYKPYQVAINLFHSNQHVQYIKGANYIDTFVVHQHQPNNDTVVNLSIQLGDKEPKNISLKKEITKKRSLLTTQINPILELTDSIKIWFNNPTQLANYNQLMVYQDTLKINFKLCQINPFEWAVVYPYEEKKTYHLQIPDSCFIDNFGCLNSKQKQSFTLKSNKDYASLLLKLKTKEAIKHPVLVYLISEDEKQIIFSKSIKGNTDINLMYLLPDNYKVKYVFDVNENGKWDNGDFNTKTQPEKVGYFNQIIKLKPYWELEQSVLIE